MIRRSFATFLLTVSISGSSIAGLVGCNNLTKPDDIVVAPEPRRAGAAPSPSGAPQALPAPRPAAPPPG